MNQALRCIGIIALESCLVGCLGQASLAQISPDASYSTAVSGGELNFVVTGGQVSGTNLFHRFDRLSVPVGGSVEFDHDPNVETIFSRVTGAEASTIDGVVRADASLYLLNPQGIVFGPNAELQLGGDFVASTAEQIQFSDGISWGIPLAEQPLLSVGVPVGLQLGAGSRNLLVQAQGGDDGGGNPVGLAVASGRRLSLIAGEVALDQGTITAPGGVISLVGLSEGRVGLSEGGALDSSLLSVPLDPNASWGNIDLSQGSRVSTSGGGGNGVWLYGDRITLSEQSRILADNLSQVAGQGITAKARQLSFSDRSAFFSSAWSSGDGGDITLNLEEFVEFQGTGYSNLEQTFVLGALSGRLRLEARDRLTGLVTGTVGAGDSGAIRVNVPQLQLREGSSIWAPTFGLGRGGDIDLEVPHWLDHRASAIATSTYFLGTSGNLTIETDRFDITQSAFLNTSTFSPASGGNVKIQAGDLTLEEPLPNTVAQNAIFSSSIGSTGIPGDVIISSERILASAGGQITSTGGAELSIASIPLGGPGGNVNIKAEESVILTGVGDFQPTQLSATSYSDSPAGSLEIWTPLLILQDGARLLATSSVGEGGNISVHAEDGVLLRNGSDIIATATGIGDGGNIELDTSILLLLGNSRITANAQQGVGGNIDISSQLLLRSQDSGISASSALGKEFSGRIQLNQAQVDSSQLTPSLPKALLESDEGRIVAACNAEEDQEFIVSGRGGLPLGVRHALESQPLWQDERLPRKLVASVPRSSLDAEESWGQLGPVAMPEPRQEAIAFRKTLEGEVALVLHPPTEHEAVAPSALLSQAEVCRKARQG